MIVAVTCIGAFLLAANVFVNIWRYQAMDWFSMDYVYMRVALSHALALSIGRVVAFIVEVLNSKGKEWVSIPAYAALLVFGTYIAVFGSDGRYLGGGVTYFSPTMMYAAIFVSSYVAAKDFGKLWNKCASFLLIFSLPVILAVVGSHSVSVGFASCAIFIMLLMKVFFIDEKHPRRWTVVLVLSVTIIVLFIACGGTGMIDALTTRFETFMSSGRNDPTGTGYVYYQLLNGLKEAQMVGPSSYEIAINSQTSMPAYVFLADQGSVYSIAAVILRWGGFPEFSCLP